MARHIDATGGALFAEALSFALAARMPRPEAQARVKTLITEAAATGDSLARTAAAAYPDLDLGAVLDPMAQLGQAPATARAFAKEARP